MSLETDGGPINPNKPGGASAFERAPIQNEDEAEDELLGPKE